MDIQEISHDLLRQAARGEMQAFEEVYKYASSFVYSVALRTVRNREDAQEITQEVFLKVFKNLKDFKFKSSFKTWLYRITVNTALNVIKKTGHDLRRQVAYNENMMIEDSRPENATDSILDNQDKEKKVHDLLAVLTLEYRVCIVLREIQGLSYEEIAQTLKTNINTVRSRLKRARAILLKRGGYA